MDENSTLANLLDKVDAARSAVDAKVIAGLSKQYAALGTPIGRAWERFCQGVEAHFEAEYKKALEILESAIPMFQEIGALYGVAKTHNEIGMVYNAKSQTNLAVERLKIAQSFFHEIHDTVGVAGCYNNLALLEINIGNFENALEYFERAQQGWADAGMKRGAAAVAMNIGLVYDATSNFPSALEQFNLAARLHGELGNTSVVAGAWMNAGGTYVKLGDYSSALENFNRALEVFARSDNKLMKAFVEAHIGSMHKDKGEYEVALEYMERSFKVMEDLDSIMPAVGAMCEVADLHIAMGNLEAAERVMENVDKYEVDEIITIIWIESNKAAIMAAHGRHAEAQELWKSTLKRAETHSLLAQEVKLHKTLRDHCRTTGDFDGYVEHNNSFTTISEKIRGGEAQRRLAIQQKQNELELERREHQKHMAVLHSTLPKHIADRVARGELVSDHFENASVIFLDIVGFTTISDRIPSGHVVHLLEQIFTTLDAACEKHNVVKIKTIGDSYMAVSFRAFAGAQDDAVMNAATCALDMIASLGALVITMPPALADTSWTKDVGDIQVRIGIHCGPVTAGVIGTQRMQYDVWGDTVNVASRMESTSEPGRIHVSEAFAKALRSADTTSDPLGDTIVDSITIEPRGTMEIKGKGKMQTFWLYLIKD